MEVVGANDVEQVKTGVKSDSPDVVHGSADFESDDNGYIDESLRAPVGLVVYLQSL